MEREMYTYIYIHKYMYIYIYIMLLVSLLATEVRMSQTLKALLPCVCSSPKWDRPHLKETYSRLWS